MLDIAIIGGGPAGLSAGLYAARGGANAALYEALFTGGQAVKTHRIDNYPGFADGVEGFELGMKLEQHAARFGLPVEYAGVARLSLSDDVKRIELSDGRTVETKALILAMGAKPRTLGLAREEELIGSGVSYCATCDGAFFKDRPVAVVGGGAVRVTEKTGIPTVTKQIKDTDNYYNKKRLLALDLADICHAKVNNPDSDMPTINPYESIKGYLGDVRMGYGTVTVGSDYATIKLDSIPAELAKKLTEAIVYTLKNHSNRII